MGERTQKAWDHLKDHQNVYTFLCILSALVGIYTDYKADVAEIESKAKAIDSERVDSGTEMQQNMKLVYERAIAVENRLSILETKMAGVEKDNSSFWTYILGIDRPGERDSSGDGIPDTSDYYPAEPEPPVARTTRKKKIRADDGAEKAEEESPWEDFDLPAPPPLEQKAIKPVFR